MSGGEFVWETHKGWNTHCSATACDWKAVHDTGAASQITALAVDGNAIYAGYCGYGCNPADTFYAGIDTNYGGTWHTVAGPGMKNGGDQLPQRVLANIVADPDHPGHVFAIYSGYSRRWIPGGGVGHVFESWNGGASWKDISGNLPDAPADDLVLSNHQLVLATDVGMFVTPAASPGVWKRFGHGLPNAVVNDLTDDAERRHDGRRHARPGDVADRGALERRDTAPGHCPNGWLPGAARPHRLGEQMFDSLVLGVDPGVARLGLAVVGRSGRTPTLVWADTVRTGTHQQESARLLVLALAVRAAIADHAPTTVAIERVAFNRNIVSALASRARPAP